MCPNLRTVFIFADCGRFPQSECAESKQERAQHRTHPSASKLTGVMHGLSPSSVMEPSPRASPAYPKSPAGLTPEPKAIHSLVTSKTKSSVWRSESLPSTGRMYNVPCECQQKFVLLKAHMTKTENN